MTFALLLASLVFAHTLDCVMLNAYMTDPGAYETFPPLRWAAVTYGLSAAVWLTRAAVYALMLAVVWGPRGARTNGLLVVLNCLYWSSMLDWVFVLRRMS